MSANRLSELAVGFFVALGIAALTLLAFKVSNIGELNNDKTYTVQASFENIGSLKVRAPVTLAGVRIGRVAGIDIDTRTFEAVVKLALSPAYPLPVDTSASILTAGLLGEQYVGLEPGGAEQILKAGDTIKLTQSALVLERLIGQFLYRAAEGSGTSQ
ncbi:MAG: outer membrane lipid asymmetry maintenance protein MlaD [Candidatus Competibacteraceae bacterium]|nr:outer membrane lipid asymmetry maintenance protein MlaD [Candidatus Competibacteraceae bacterium]MCB1813542.1 outer membrane lipid asymmetry maintenance protein MlaD [Candidatus Competibacteraceae bacterium]